MWIIKNSNGMWVRSGGRKSSYTNRKEFADRYGSYDDALRNCCGNEHVEEYEP